MFLLQATTDALVENVSNPEEALSGAMKFWAEWKPTLMDYGIRLIGAIVVFAIGFFIANKVANLVARAIEKRKLDEGLKSFLKSTIGTLLKILVVITALGILGIEMTSFVAFLGAAGLAVGMALSGTLQNFAGGVMILIFKPFKVGDYLEAQGQQGIVDQIQIFNTRLKTLDNKVVYLPNAPLSSGAMINYTQEPIRRVDMTFGIGYSDDIDKAKATLREILAQNENILQDPVPDVYLSELADSSVNFAVRPWCKPEHYWDVYFYTHEAVKKTFDQKGISIPFPQRDVHLHQAGNAS